MAKEKKKNAHYIDNKQFLEAMKEWKQKCVDAEEAGEERPQVTNYIGECFLKIAKRILERTLKLLLALAPKLAGNRLII